MSKKREGSSDGGHNSAYKLVQKFKDDIRKKEARLKQEEEDRRKELNISDLRLGDFRASKKSSPAPGRNASRGQQVRAVS